MGNAKNPPVRGRRRPARPLHPDDHDAALRIVVILVVRLAARRRPAMVGKRHLELGTLVATTLLFFATSNLLNDPGFEHRRPTYMACNIVASQSRSDRPLTPAAPETAEPGGCISGGFRGDPCGVALTDRNALLFCAGARRRAPKGGVPVGMSPT